MKTILLFVCLLLLGTSAVAAEPGDEALPEILPQRVIFRTEFGDLVFALYKDVAPTHTAQILALVEAGAYRGTHIHRVEPNYLIQISRIHERLIGLSAEQKNLEKKLEGEFSQTLKHKLGSLTMAQMPGDPNSATSSIAILLRDAPNLDGKFSQFGYLESGATTVKRILALPREGSKPLKRVTIRQSLIHREIDRYYANHPIDPPNRIETAKRSASGGALDSEGESTGLEEMQDGTEAIVGLFCILLLLPIVGWLFYGRLSKSNLLSLLMLEALVAGFGVLLLVTPWGHREDWLAALLFVGMLSMFKFMNQFESKN